jgi:MoCo/4Fe-4S cofactor protein with predicted Tat translocation signal
MSAELAITRSQYWQSLQEAGDSQAPVKTLPSEFPDGASEWLDPLGRRSFLKLMSASIALAGVGACTRQPFRAIVPYVRQPEELIPGRPLFFAGYARGVLVETHEG